MHRKLLGSAVWHDPKLLKLWIYVLLRANHSPDTVVIQGRIIKLEAGQFLTGRDKIVEATGLSGTTIERGLKVFESMGQIGQQKTNKYRVITILNWDQYQKDEQQKDNKKTTNGQHTDTNKNVKNVKKVNTPAPSAEVAEVINLFKEVNPSYQRLFGMPPQRAATDRLLKVHGKEKLMSMIAFLPKSNSSKYAPVITTPVQFEAKLGDLIAWSQKQKDTAHKKAKVAFV